MSKKGKYPYPSTNSKMIRKISRPSLGRKGKLGRKTANLLLMIREYSRKYNKLVWVAKSMGETNKNMGTSITQASIRSMRNQH
jgi:hypothetical protein